MVISELKRLGVTQAAYVTLEEHFELTADVINFHALASISRIKMQACE